jgi:hypothetical protein
MPTKFTVKVLLKAYVCLSLLPVKLQANLSIMNLNPNLKDIPQILPAVKFSKLLLPL